VYDNIRSVQQKQEATRAKRYSTYLSTSKMEGTKNGGNRIQFPYTSYLTTQKK